MIEGYPETITVTPGDTLVLCVSTDPSDSASISTGMALTSILWAATSGKMALPSIVTKGSYSSSFVLSEWTNSDLIKLR